MNEAVTRDRIRALVRENTRLGRGAHKDAARAHRTKERTDRGLALILERAERLAASTNEAVALNLATVITHLVEAMQGDAGALASLRVLGTIGPEEELEL